jgi:MinD-like ATPase involved in chromosome partitioning or flagellar assembly/DNA-binding NarL/FixJ family response regulator
MNTILFIENDMYWFQQISSHFMLRPEYKVEHSSNLLEAMNRINSGSNYYGAIVLNVNSLMQNSDTKQIIANIKEKIPFAKIICVLENNDPYQFVSLNQNGANGVLLKPYSVDALIAEIEKDGSPFSTSQSPNNYGMNPNGYHNKNNPNMPPFGIPYQQNQQENINKGNIENPENVRIDNLGDMGQQTGEMHEFKPKQFDTTQPENQQSYDRPYGQQFNPYGQQNPPYNNRQPYSNQQQYGYTPDMQGGEMPPYNQRPQGYPNHRGNMHQYPGAPRPNSGIVRIPKNITIAVHCPKGGVGKSSIAKELAITYALSSINGQRLRVCLVDMDIDYGDIAVMLELKQNKSIADWARNIRARMGNMNESDILFSYEEIEKYYLLQHKSGLKVLAAPTNYRDAALINEQIVRIVINNLKQQFDVVIIDTGNNVKDFTVVSMEMADHIVMVCNVDVSTINEILTLRKTLEQIQFPMSKIGLVMNEIKKGDEAHIDQISNFLGLPLIGVIPRIQAIEMANNNGEALVMGKDNAFTIGIKKVANTILPVVKRGDGGRPGGTDESGSKERKSLFASLFKRNK